MSSRLQKQAKKLLQAIEFEPAPLSTNKGKYIRTDHCPNKVNSKERRHRGWITGRLAGKGKYSEIFAEAIEPQEFWDDCQDHRDGRRYDPDDSHIRNINMYHRERCKNCRPTCHVYDTCQFKEEVVMNPIYRINIKLKRHEEIRRARKEREKERLKNMS